MTEENNDMDLHGTSSEPVSTQSYSAQTRSPIFARGQFLSKLSRKKIIALAVVACLLIVSTAGAVIVNSQKDKKDDTAQEEIAEIPSELIDDLSFEDGIGSASTVAINGELLVNSALVVTPTDRPAVSKTGQIYFEGSSSNFLYYDGTTYRTIADTERVAGSLEAQSEFVTSTLTQNEAIFNTNLTTAINQQNQFIEETVRTLQNATGDVDLVAGRGINIDGLVISNTGVTSLQGASGDLNFIAGAGMRIDGLTLTNAGVTSLQGTANQVLVSNDTGAITISLPQDINIGATPHFAGITLDNALDVTSGGTGTDGSNLESNSLVYFDGSKLATITNPEDPFLCLVSTFNVPTFMPCSSAIPEGVTSLNGLKGDITILNADTDPVTGTITPHIATTSRAGLVSTTAQSFSGLKTFNAGINIGFNQAITADSNITIQPASNRDIIFNTTGNGRLLVSNLDCSASGNGGKLTVNANGEIICAADTGGDGVGVESVSADDASINVDITDGANPKISVNLQGGGGLTTTNNGLGLLDSCSDDQVLKYNSTTGWGCAQDADTTDGECSSCVALQSTTPGTAQVGNINIDGTILAANAGFSGNATIGNNLTINGTGLIRTLTDSGQAFEVQSAAGASVLNANTENLSVTIGAFGFPTSPLGDYELPQTPYFTEQFVGGPFSNVQDIVIHRNYGYVLLRGSANVVVYDLTDPSKPRHIRNYTTAVHGNNLNSIAAHGDRLYVTSTNNNRLIVSDISDPEDPQYLGRFSFSNTTQTIAATANHVFIPNGGNRRLQVVDITDPSNMSFVATPAPELPVNTSPQESFIVGNYLYYTDLGLNEFVIWDISDPAAPIQVGQVNTDAHPKGLAVRGNYAFVANQTAGTLSIIDISDKENPFIVSSVGIVGSPQSVSLAGDRAFVVGYNDALLQMIDIGDVENPVVHPVTSSTAAAPIDVEVHKGHVFVAARTNGVLQAWSLGSANTLTVYGDSQFDGVINALGAKISGTLESRNIEAETVRAGELLTNSLDTQGVEALNIGSNNASSININQDTTFAEGKTVTIQGNTTIIQNSVNAFSVNNSLSENLFNVDTSGKTISIGIPGMAGGSTPGSDPTFSAAMPTGVAGSSSTNMITYDMHVHGNYAYLANLAGNHLEIFDISDPNNPTSVGGRSFGSGSGTFVGSDGIHAAVSVANVVRLADVTNPANPVIRGSYTPTQGGYVPNGGGTVRAIEVRGNTMFVVYTSNDGYSYIDSVNISNPNSPVHIHTRTLLANTSNIEIATDGDYMYIAINGNPTLFSAIRSINMAQPTTLPMTNYNTTSASGGPGSSPRAIAAKNGTVYVGYSDTSRIVSFDHSDRSSPVVPISHVALPTAEVSDLAISPDGPFVFATDQIAALVYGFDVTNPENMTNIGQVSVANGHSNPTTTDIEITQNALVIINRNAGIVTLGFGVSSTPGSGAGGVIAMNQDTFWSAGAILNIKGHTTISTDSENAFQVQNAAGDDILRIDTESGNVIAGVRFAVGANTGITASCDIGETLNNLTVVGGIITGGTCGDGTGEGGGEDPEGPIQSDDGILTDLIDTINAGGVLNIGTDNASQINLNQNTVLADGKTLEVNGDVTIKTTSETALTVSDGDDNRHLVIDTQNGQITIGVEEAPPSGGGSGELAMPEAATGSVNTVNQPSDVIVNGNYAYVTSNNRVDVFDVSNKSAPALVEGKGITVTGAGRLQIKDNYLYAVSTSSTGYFHVIDISTPDTPTLVRTLTGATLGSISWIGDFTISGNHAYITETNNNRVVSVNITNPTTASYAGQTSAAVAMLAEKVAASEDGNYLYVTDYMNNGFVIIDITNPAAPVKVGGLISYGGFNAPRSMTTGAGHLFINSGPSSASPGTMHVYDVSSPATPVKVADVPTDGFITDMDVAESGEFIALSSNRSHTAQAFDITDPSSPVNLGSLSTAANSAPIAISAQGNAMYMVTQSTRMLYIFEIEGASGGAPETPSARSITLNNNTTLAQGKSLNVQGDTAIKTDSETAFNIQNASDVDIFNVDTINGVVTVADLNVSGEATIDTLTVTTAASFEGSIVVDGDATFNGTLTLNGHVVTAGDQPTAAVQANAGGGATCFVDGNDTAGMIVVVGGSDATAGIVCELTFNSSFNNQPKTIISPTEGPAAEVLPWAHSSQEVLKLGVNGELVQGQAYGFNYWNVE